MWTLATASSRKRSAAEVARTCASAWAAWSAEYVVLDDLNNGAQKPIQIRFYGTDMRKLQELTQAFVKHHAGHQRARWMWAIPSGDPQNELQIEMDRGLREPARHLESNDAARRCAWPFAGVEVGDWWTPPAKRVTWPCACTRLTGGRRQHRALPIGAVSGTNRMVPLDQIATVTMGRAGPDPARRRQAHHRRSAMPRAARPAG